MKTNTLFGVVLLLLIIAAIWFGYAHRSPEAMPSESVSNEEEMAVRGVVTEFGTKLQMVSLLSSTANRKAAMDAAYGAYVAPKLLATWYPEGAPALGRQTSSPWPERIEVVEVNQSGDHFLVNGNVIEVTSTEAGTLKAPAAIYSVDFELENQNGHWMIIKANKGAYSEIPHSQTIIGYWECLPHKDTSGPQTMECAFGIAADQSDGHYAIDTSLMAKYPVDFPTGTKVRVTGLVTPANQLNSIQKYDIDGIIRATTIEKI